MGTEVNEFLMATMPRLNEAKKTLHNGDAGPRLAMWSRETSCACSLRASRTRR
jgi:hypothetical protein